MSESLRNDGRIWVPKKQGDNTESQSIFRKKKEIITWKEDTRLLVTWCPAMWLPVQQKKDVMRVMVWVHPNRLFTLILQHAIERYGKAEAGKQELDNADDEQLIQLGKEVVKEKYGNLFDMYEKITGENPYEVPMRIYPAVHYTMGGLVGGL